MEKKAEFIANQAKDFYTDKRVERVIYMLDWGEREFSVTNLGAHPSLFLHDESSKTSVEKVEHFKQKYIVTKKYVILADALRWHGEGPAFTKIEIYVREEFDWFFFRLELFEEMLRSEIFSYEEIEAHLNYVLDLVSKGKENVGRGLQDAIYKYTKNMISRPLVAL